MMKPLRPCPVFAARTFWTPGESRGGGLSGLFGDIYDAPTLGGWVIVQYDIPATTSTDTDLNALPVSWVSLPAVS